MEDKRDVVIDSMIAVKEDFPNADQVRLIYKDTYNFYTKWIAVKELNWETVIAESRDIEQKHPFELCRKILVEVVAIIEAKVIGGLHDG